MFWIESRIRVLIVLILLIGIIWVDKPTDMISYGGLIFIIFILSPRKFLPILLPLPVALAIVGMNILFLEKPLFIKAIRFYFASAIALQYSTISRGNDIAGGIGGLMKWFGFKDNTYIYTSISAAKKINLKNLTLKNIPEKLSDLINQQTVTEVSEIKSYKIRPLDILYLVASITFVTLIFII